MTETSIEFDGLTLLRTLHTLTIEEVWQEASTIGLTTKNSYLTQNGRILVNDPTQGCTVRIAMRLVGGKGGFGSMLRAIGAQIEKTTNREACRDLSGRRLKDINEEKRLREWLERQKDEPEDPSEKFKKKISKLLAKPKHEFKDEEYMKQRTDLTANMDDAVEQGMKRIEEGAVKRAAEGGKWRDAKKPKGAVWTGLEDFSSGDSNESSDSDEDFQDETMQNILSLYLRERLAEAAESGESNESAQSAETTVEVIESGSQDGIKEVEK